MFTTSCFIRKNTPELKKRLEELGKTLSEKSVKYGDALGSCKGDKYLIFEGWRIKSSKDIIDCGDNEELFFALAALRDDTDYMQLFKDDMNRWIRCDSYSFVEYCYIYGYRVKNWHKATEQELIEHFNK